MKVENGVLIEKRCAMGLDSVELVMEWENYFEISIPDREAEQIKTIQDAVNCISRHIRFAAREIDIKEEMLRKITAAMQAVKEPVLPLSGEQKIFEIIPVTEFESWKRIAEITGYEMPAVTGRNALVRLLENILPSKTDTAGTSIERFADLTCAVNYQKLIRKGQIRNEYEIQTAVTGMTIEKTGISPFYVFPDKSFVNDLGID